MIPGLRTRRRRRRGRAAPAVGGSAGDSWLAFHSVNPMLRARSNDVPRWPLAISSTVLSAVLRDCLYASSSAVLMLWPGAIASAYDQFEVWYASN